MQINKDSWEKFCEPFGMSEISATYKATARLKYIQHWEQQIEELETAVKAVGLATLQGITDDLNLYTKIRNSIAGLTDTLKNMNTLTLEIYRNSIFDMVIDAVKAKLAEYAYADHHADCRSTPYQYGVVCF